MARSQARQPGRSRTSPASCGRRSPGHSRHGRKPGPPACRPGTTATPRRPRRSRPSRAGAWTAGAAASPDSAAGSRL
jgi:hypothetical protein